MPQSIVREYLVTKESFLKQLEKEKAVSKMTITTDKDKIKIRLEAPYKDITYTVDKSLYNEIKK